MQVGSVKSTRHDIVVEPLDGAGGIRGRAKNQLPGRLHHESTQEVADHCLAVPMHLRDLVGRADGQIGLPWLFAIGHAEKS